MIEKMRFAVLTKAHTAKIHERPLPELGEDDVLVKQVACNICTTDYGQWMGLREHQGYPMAGGHEVSGIVVAKGEKVSDELQIGDHVAVTDFYCGQCEVCKKGLIDACLNKKPLTSEDGYRGRFGYADYNVIKAKFLVKMNKDLPPEQAAFLEPVASVLNGIRRLRIQPMETVVVIGAGTMGIINAQVARAFGARVIVTELMDKKIKCAQSLGFEVVDAKNNDPVKKILELTDGKKPDAVVVAVGVSQANQQALEMVKNREGRILFFAAGYPAPELKIDSNIIHYRKLELIGAYESTLYDFYDAAKMLNQRFINVEPLVEAVFPLDDIQKAYEVASTLGNYRVSVKLQ
jgi:L-iditol 2-dehydrogenase